jgi:hypothetical protein
MFNTLKTLTAAAALLAVAGAAHAEQKMPKWQGMDYQGHAKCVKQLDGSWICSDGEQYNGNGRPLHGICTEDGECHQPAIPACWAQGCRRSMR